MKTIYILCLFCCVSLNSYSQAWVWEKPIYTTNNSIATDPNNNIIVLSKNGNATQLSKFTKDGLLIWSNRLTKATAFTPSGSVVADKNGNIYTFTEGFDSVNSQFTGVKPQGITKFGPNGDVLWHVYYSASTVSLKLAIQVDDNGNVYVGFSDQQFGPVTITLGNTTTTTTANNYYLSIGSVSPSGSVRWLRGFQFNKLNGTFAGATSMSIANNNLYVAGYMAKYQLILDNGLILSVDRCSAWLATFDCSNGQSKWGKTHNLFYYCLGITCSCSNPSIYASSSSGKVALTKTLNGAFVFRPLDTIAAITAIGQPTVKSYYTIYDTSSNPVKGKIIETVPDQFSYHENITGSRNNFFFVQYSNSNPVPGFRDTLRKVDTGFNLIWQVTLPPAIDKIFIPQNTNDIIATYSRAGVIYLAKMTDSAGVISGRTYADWDDNGVYTTADSALSNILITTNSYLTNGISGNDSGKYYMYAAPGTYNLSANFNHPYYQFLPATQSATINSFSDSVRGKDFRLRPLVAFTDVSVNFTALSVARPGQPVLYDVTVKNFGATATSIDVGLKLPPLTSYASISGGSVTVNAPDSITIAMGSVSPFAVKKAILTLNVSTTATINDTLRYYPKAYPYTTDTIKQNNRDTLLQAVRTSFDPNEKEVSVQKQLWSDTGKAIVYTVHFQNTGNDTAFYVRIADTLSSKHDIKTFSFINASHPVSTEINNNIINFIFNPISLPDSNHNENQSHGFVKFSIKPKAPFSLTDTLYNRSAIYFDYNSPVITNSAKSWYYQGAVIVPPVFVLLSFTGEKQGSSVLLKFVTASEPGLALFIIERSPDSINYIPLGAINAQGTAITGSSYQFVDNSPEPVANFYRLKIVYRDGRIGYSGVVVIRYLIPPPPSPIDIKIFPNPVRGTLYFTLKNVPDPKIFNCIMSDATGRIVWSAKIDVSITDTYTLNTDFLPGTIYFITLSNENLTYRKKIVVIH